MSLSFNLCCFRNNGWQFEVTTQNEAKIACTKSRHDRLQEEKFLLCKEMANILKYYLNIPAGLESQVKGCK